MQKLTRTSLNGVSERDLFLKDKFAFFEASKNPIPKRRKLLAKRTFLQAKKASLKTPFKLDRVSFSTPEIN